MTAEKDALSTAAGAAQRAVCNHTEHAMRGDGRYGRSFPKPGPEQGFWELCPERVESCIHCTLWIYTDPLGRWVHVLSRLPICPVTVAAPVGVSAEQQSRSEADHGGES